MIAHTPCITDCGTQGYKAPEISDASINEYDGMYWIVQYVFDLILRILVHIVFSYL